MMDRCYSHHYKASTMKNTTNDMYNYYSYGNSLDNIINPPNKNLFNSFEQCNKNNANYGSLYLKEESKSKINDNGHFSFKNNEIIFPPSSINQVNNDQGYPIFSSDNKQMSPSIEQQYHNSSFNELDGLSNGQLQQQQVMPMIHEGFKFSQDWNNANHQIETNLANKYRLDVKTDLNLAVSKNQVPWLGLMQPKQFETIDTCNGFNERTYIDKTSGFSNPNSFQNLQSNQFGTQSNPNVHFKSVGSNYGFGPTINESINWSHNQDNSNTKFNILPLQRLNEMSPLINKDFQSMQNWNFVGSNQQMPLGFDAIKTNSIRSLQWAHQSPLVDLNANHSQYLSADAKYQHDTSKVLPRDRDCVQRNASLDMLGSSKTISPTPTNMTTKTTTKTTTMMSPFVPDQPIINSSINQSTSIMNGNEMAKSKDKNESDSYNQASPFIIQKSGISVWCDDVEAAFQEAIKLFQFGPENVPQNSLVPHRKFKRNMMISRYIYMKTGKVRTVKQISSHIQVDKKRRALMQQKTCESN